MKTTLQRVREPGADKYASNDLPYPLLYTWTKAFPHGADKHEDNVDPPVPVRSSDRFTPFRGWGDTAPASASATAVEKPRRIKDGKLSQPVLSGFDHSFATAPSRVRPCEIA